MRSIAYVVGSANAIGWNTPGSRITGNAAPDATANRKFVQSMKKFASLISSTTAASRYAMPIIATIASATAGRARTISGRKRRPKNAIPTAKIAIWLNANQNRPPSARPRTMTSREVGVSHVGSSVPASISFRMDIAIAQNAVATRPLMTPPRKMKPARSAVPIVRSSPTTRPATANDAPKRSAGRTPWDSVLMPRAAS